MVGLLDEQQAKDAVREYLESREWWLFIEPENQGRIQAVEKTFYDGPANEDFHALLLPRIAPGVPILALYLGGKKRLPRGKLESWLRGQPGVPAGFRIADEQDVLVFASNKDWMVLPAIIGRWAGITPAEER